MKPPKRTAAYKRGVAAANIEHAKAIELAESIDIDSVPVVTAYGDVGNRERELRPTRDLARNSLAWLRGER